MRIARHISELIGNTPLVQLNSVVPEGSGKVLAKIEYLNPGGSSKDRIAAVLASFDPRERHDMVEPDGKIHVTCEYCATVYKLEPDDVVTAQI